MLVAAIDNGYYNTVAMTTAKNTSFRSKVQETSRPQFNKDSYYLQYNGKSYLVGDEAEKIDIDLDKTNSQLHFITTLAALGSLSSATVIPAKIVSNIPINLYNKDNKKKIEDFFKSKSGVQFILNDKKKSVSILDCVVFPQAIPAIYANQIEPTTGVLDIGGLTAQGAITKDKKIIQSTIFTDNLGMLVLLEKIKNELNSKYNTNLKDYEMETVFSAGLLEDKENSLKIIEEICMDHIERIITALKLKDWNVNNTNILLTGGGGMLLAPYLKKKIKHIRLSNNPLLDNTLGLLEVSRHVFA